MQSVMEHSVTQDHDTVIMKERKIRTFELQYVQKCGNYMFRLTARNSSEF